MRIDYVHIKTRFKNLEDFEIDIDQYSMETVLIGLNATGKSNFLEALLIIFGTLELEHKDKSDLIFSYFIKYKCWNNEIEIEYDYIKDNYIFKIGGKIIKRSQFFVNKRSYLPKHLFIYYSGISNRLGKYYDKHIEDYYRKIINPDATYEEFKEIQPIFLVQDIHGSLALLSFFLKSEESKETLEFLKKELHIHDLISTLFIIKEPVWKRQKKEDDFLWGATGLVRRFLTDLFLFSLAPIYNRLRSTKYNKTETNELLYLFIKDKETFNDFVSLKYLDRNQLFNALISPELSNMLHGIKIKVNKEDVNGELSMSELSEGEQQLLTVLGLLKFTKDEESLILLDEPDTHLNPQWKWKYLDFLNRVVNKPESTQIIFCTHDPLVIGSLDRKQVRIFKKENEKTITVIPKISPNEMSVDKILTSELFGIPSVMSKELEDKLNAKRYLQTKIVNNSITEKELEEYEKLKDYLDYVGFYDKSLDSRYAKYLELLNQKKEFAFRDYTDQEKAELDKIAEEVLAEILKN